MEKDEAVNQFNRLYEITRTLRSENGCPWDKAQTPESVRTCLHEELYEVLDAIDSKDALHVKEELGDEFFNLLLLSYMYQQNEDFSVADVLNDVSEKLIRRHPHVFGNEKLEGDDKLKTQINQWENIKANVEGRKTECVLDTVPESFPPLLKAYKYVKKASKAGFDWRSVESSKAKVLEELKEVENATDSENLEEELGDLLFAVVHYCAKNGVDPTIALNKANNKFYKRFSFVEKSMQEMNKPMCEENDEIMLNQWKKAKKQQ